MNTFECYIKNMYPHSIIKYVNGKTIVLTEKGINFSFVCKNGYYNIDFVYVFDEVKCKGIFNDFVNNLLKSKCNVKMINIVSGVVNQVLKKYCVNVISKMECIEIPVISFKINPESKIEYSEEELDAIDNEEEEFLINDDGFYEDYVISVA